MSRLAAGFLQQLHFADGHRAIHRLAHVVDGEQTDAHQTCLMAGTYSIGTRWEHA